MSPINRRLNSGFALAELMIAMMVATSIIAGIAFYLAKQQADRRASQYAEWMAQYLNAVAAYVSSQGATPPGTLVRTGTDWLKNTTCGGIQPIDAYYLSCNVPTNFNGVYDLPAPVVSFDWSTPTAPKAQITFGVVEKEGGPAPKMASMLAAEINTRLEVDGYNLAGVFIVDPAIDPNTNPAGFQAELASANLRGFVDSSIESTVFVRRDGNTVMTGPLVNESNSWAMIARKADGTENAEMADPDASLNVNDVYARSTDSWLSETHQLAEAAMHRALRAPIEVTTVRSGSYIYPPQCNYPGLAPKIIATPIGAIGGSSSADAQALNGFRVRLTNPWWTSATYVVLETLSKSSSTSTAPATWRQATGDKGLIQVITKCTDT
ncbi:type II secretion system protein [Marinobacter subterrani]|uniref:type II secretion system protein n=1 Tax=Marinobacter subterrani TaxID=1658765 RepID=UPI002353A2C4|nr:type II secretion system protein [Marinobacter subterrani]